MSLNGKPLERTYLHQAKIVAGGELHFTTQAKRDRHWASDDTARPAAMSHYGL